MSGSGDVTLRIDAGRVPLLEGALLLADRNRPGGGATNRAHFSPGVVEAAALDDSLRALLYDPQTSGGLLVALAADAAAATLEALRDAGVPAAALGEAIDPRPGTAVLLV
jgi:selenide,water dikinase